MIQCINADYVGIPNLVPWSIIEGTSLHFKYSGNANMNFRTGSIPPGGPPSPDYVPQQIDVEFESPSTFTVPFDGTLTFMGGNLGIGQKGPADFKVYVYYDDRPCSGRPDDPIDTSNYAPMFHWLKHYSNPLVPFVFTVPENHTYLLGQNPTDVFTVNGVTVQPGVNAPGMIVSPGDLITAPPNKVVTTGWLG
jgi:hypothetical protein